MKSAKIWNHLASSFPDWISWRSFCTIWSSYLSPSIPWGLENNVSKVLHWWYVTGDINNFFIFWTLFQIFQNICFQIGLCDLNSSRPINLVFLWKSSSNEFLDPEHWIVQDFFARLIDESTSLKFFVIQVQKHIFSNVFQARIFNDILHIVKSAIVLLTLLKCFQLQLNKSRKTVIFRCIILLFIYARKIEEVLFASVYLKNTKTKSLRPLNEKQIHYFREIGDKRKCNRNIIRLSTLYLDNMKVY